MRIFRSLNEISPSEFSAPIVSIGVFDGMHLGHQLVIKELVRWAKGIGGESVIITFDKHPQAFLSKNPPPSLSSMEYRMRYLADNGVDAVLMLPFDAQLANLEPDGFVQTILSRHIGVSGVLLGFDTKYGKGGKGDFSHLALMAEIIGFQAKRVSVLEVDGERVSSSLVRSAVIEGDLDKAAKLLGRNFCIEGVVVQGMQRGTSLGFPTANLDRKNEVMPPSGVYAGKAHIEYGDDGSYDALISIGRHATFGSHLPEDLVEVLLLDFDGNLYGKNLSAEIVFKMREQREFRNKEELVGQISRDVASYRADLVEKQESL